MIKTFLKRTFNRVLRSTLNEVELECGSKIAISDAVAQQVLAQNYRLLATSEPAALPTLREVGFRTFSQFEEDGILLYIFSLIPPVNRKCVEICAGNGRECMTANLIVNHGWWGYLFDGSNANVDAGNRFFANNKDTFLHPPVFRKAWITAENINHHLESAGVAGPIDLLSLDIDGMDYWVWKAIEVVQPRVFVCETHNAVPPGISVTVPYDPNFICQSEDYRGASLEAMCKLGRQKGYRLIGTHRYGFNAFYIQNGVGEDFFPEVTAESCLNDPFSEKRRQDWVKVKTLDWHGV
jgi:hypothetical protein